MLTIAFHDHALRTRDWTLTRRWAEMPTGQCEAIAGYLLAHQVGVLSSEPEEARRVHETGFCWCGAYHEEPPKQSVWWLIERPTGGQPIWWTGDDSAYPWSTDANNARRFVTKEAAQEQITTLSGIGGVHEPFGVATSHIWLDRADHLAHPLSSGAPRQQKLGDLWVRHLVEDLTARRNKVAAERTQRNDPWWTEQYDIMLAALDRALAGLTLSPEGGRTPERCPKCGGAKTVDRPSIGHASYECGHDWDREATDSAPRPEAEGGRAPGAASRKGTHGH
jgi:hypothetical protein